MRGAWWGNDCRSPAVVQRTTFSSVTHTAFTFVPGTDSTGINPRQLLMHVFYFPHNSVSTTFSYLHQPMYPRHTEQLPGACESCEALVRKEGRK